MSPYVYQFLHPWHWLIYGQNALGVQTVATVIAALAAVAAGIYAARAYGAANEQLELVREQLKLQQKENAEAAHRYAEEKARFEEEREDAKAKAKSQRQELIAAEDASRPRFRMTSAFHLGETPQSLGFKNIGESPAINVRFISPISNSVVSQQLYVPPAGTISGTFNAAEMVKEGVLIAFKNNRGTQWEVKYFLNAPGGEDEIVQRVIRPSEES